MFELPKRPARPRSEGYGWHDLAGDAMGGAIAALVALPYGLALAQLMGLAARAWPLHFDPDRAGHFACWAATRS